MNTIEYLKMEGREEGREKAQEVIVENLLKETDFSVEKIAALADVPVEIVNKIKSNLHTR